MVAKKIALLEPKPKKAYFSPKSNSPKVLFLGEGTGAITLEQMLKEGVDIKKVVTCPGDAVAGLARHNDIPVLKLTKRRLSQCGLGEEIDYAVVAFTNHIISSDIARNNYGRIIGFHPSSLPRSRGGYPIESELLADRNTTEIVTFWINPRIDEGPVLMKEKFSLRGGLRSRNYGDKSVSDLYNEAAYQAGGLLAKTLFNINGIKPQKQVGEPTYFHKPTRKDLTIDWQNHTSRHILNMLRIQGKVYTKLNDHVVVMDELALLNQSPSKSIAPGSVMVAYGPTNYAVTADRKLLEIKSISYKSKKLGDINLHFAIAWLAYTGNSPRFQ